MSYFIFALLSLFVVGTVQESAGSSGEGSLGKEFKLRVGRGAVVRGEGLRAEFVSVVEDSRCPEGVNCIWAGNAKISLRLRKAGQKPATFDLNTGADPRSASHLGYEVTLVRLDPHPKADAPPNKKAYVATLLVRKK